MIDIEAIETIEKQIDEAVCWALMKWAAPIIAGRPVAIRFKEPVTTGLDGSVTVRPDGIPDVRISPGLAGDRLLYVYLHELAHVRLHADQMPRSNMYEAPPKSRTFTEYVEQDENQADENQADALRDQWLQYGKAHADPDIPQDQGIILALVDYHTNKRGKKS